MTDEKKKSVQLLTPPCEHGDAVAAIDDGESTRVTRINLRKADDNRPIQPGETIMNLERDEGAPGRYSVTGEYTHPGPSRTTTPEYRDGWDAVFGKRKPATDPKELN